MRKLILKIIFVPIFIVFISGIIVNATHRIPEKINIGLNYGTQMFHNLNIKSQSPVEIIFNIKGGLTEKVYFPQPINFSFRKDSYYNILDDEIKKIQYIKALKYSGELIGPYHIQIGSKYIDYNSANMALPSIIQVLGDAYIVYDEGWKIWSQLFLDKNQCIEQIKTMENRLVDVDYTIIEPNDNRIQVIDSSSGKVIFIINSDEIQITEKNQSETSALLEYNGLKYRGSIILKILEDNSIGVINNVLFDHYLYSVVASESPPSWHIEALKAQAVAARNYAMLNIGKHQKDGYDLCSTQHCQAYKGYDKEHINTNDAVNKTKGKLLFYEEDLAYTFYHSSSGGHTENSENIWNEAIPYLRGVEDSYSLGSPNDNWTNVLDKKFINNKLIENNISIGEIIDILPIEYSEFGRVKRVELIGTKGSVVLEKEKIRSIFGTSNIKSIWYEIKTESDLNVFNINENNITVKRPNGLSILSSSGLRKLSPNDENIIVKGLFSSVQYNVVPEKYTFSGKGWGHGLGMSQYGAKGMAEKGYDYTQILQHYYKGTRVQ